VDAFTTTVVRTVGHSNRPLEGFLRLLRAHRVTLVVDVRKMPGSRAMRRSTVTLYRKLSTKPASATCTCRSWGLAPSHAKLTELRLEERLVPGVRRLHADARVRAEF
jgi:uncharacterized protein (DUF488 family)